MQQEASFIRILADVFPPRERWFLLGVFVVSMVAACFEVVGVASILPFMALVLDPSAVDRYPVLRDVARAVGATSPRGTLLVLGAATAGIVALGNAAAALNVFVQQRFGARTLTRLSSALFDGYLRQPYAFHVDRDAPSLLKVLLTDAYYVVNGILSPVAVGVSRGVMAVGVLALLFVQDPLVALVVGAVLGVAYAVLFRLVRGRQRRLSNEANRSNVERYRISQEAFAGVKELMVLGREGHAMRLFEAATSGLATAQAGNAVVAPLPRYVLEPVAFGGILLVTLALVAKGGGSAQAAVPVLALYAFAGYRLMPALQQVFESVMSARFYLPIVRGLHEDLVLVTRISPASTEKTARSMVFTDAIQLSDVSFTYPSGAAPALRDVDLVIRPRESVGLVGRTGAGKTTLADLILGLYEPLAGRITVDGVPLTGPAIRAWRQHVGYVPQQVFLGNASVTENIAFGLAPSEIDLEAVRTAARLAQAEEFIGALPQGFDTLVGERGVKLSGGQRQRVGIARALYHQPDVLVFDEATSALDGLTEDALMEAIQSLGCERTIILIAHRLRTVEACDRIVMLEQGRIVGDAPYQDLLETSGEFRRFVGRIRAAPVGPDERV